MAGTTNLSSSSSYVEFTLLGFPGFHNLRRILFIPFLFVYVVILGTNSLIIHIVRTETSLHFPMYILMAMLSAVNICGTTTVVPKMLLSFLIDLNRISLEGCLVQMFFIYFIIMMDCNILLMMSLDRFVAICRPLHYARIINKHNLLQLTLASLVRSISFVSPVIYLASRVQFCKSDTIRHFACEHMALLSLACGNITKNKIVGLILRVTSIVFDMCFLCTSYGSIMRAALKISPGALRHKSLHTCGTHILVISIVYFFSLSSSIVYRVSRSVTQDTHNLLSAIYLLFPALANPLIYGLRTKEIQHRLFKSFGRNIISNGQVRQ
ncbi:olfactory receptor 52K1-like [Bombina bombina]|uniref:olfactory receptor 52K1-like n=1 Tax=Bombina bombina TaxID=8345 RepID=UPI00235A499F|nr:olfactory receptor 52K1-like [Bombina bombina]